MGYYKFSKKQFEWELRNLGLGYVECITEQWLAQGKETWEHIYRISTKNRAVDVIIYSSVDMRTNHVREIGNDAVRVVLRFTSRKGESFKRIGKRYRVGNLFSHLQHSIIEAQSQVFNLKFEEFSKLEEAI